MHLVENRQYKRFQVPKTTFVALWPQFVRVGQVTDISMGGLAFCHVTGAEPPSGPMELDIFLAGSPFYLYKVPIEKVWDLVPADETPCTSVDVRQCGLRFGELTESQRAQLTYLIQNYAVGEAQA